MLEPNITLQKRYQVTRLIGQGGMGAVYEAVDLRLGNMVALKQTLTPGGQLAKAFEREARLLAGLRHPSLPKVIDHFTDESGQYLVMEFIPGDDLATLLERRGAPFSVREVVSWAGPLLRVLEYLHTRQPPIMHRDIKPQNLKLTGEGGLVLLDFGLAKGDSASQTHVSITGSVFGYTPHYAPLEQIHNSGTDARSDLYALAATLHHLLTGAKPVDALTRATSVLRRLPDPLHTPTELNPRVPPEISRVLMQSLSLNQDDRPIDAAAMRAALLQAAEEADPTLVSPEATAAYASHATVRADAARPAGPTSDIALRLDALRSRLARIAPPESALLRSAQRWAVPFVVVAVILLLVAGGGRGAPGDTARPTQASAVAMAPRASVSPTGTLTAPTEATTVSITPQAPPPAGVSVPASASSLDPPDAYAGSLPITMTVRGDRLDTVREFRFTAAGGATILPQVQRSSAGEAQLLIAELPLMQGGEQPFTLYLDGAAQPVAVVLRDYQALKEMRGVLGTYAYTGRVTSDTSGAYTQMLSRPDLSGAPVAVLRAGDQVDVLRDDVAGWYQVRLWIDGQSTRTNVVGWVERWLVDGEGAPRSVTFAGRLVQTPTDAAVLCGTQFKSSVYGSVNRPNEEGIEGALVRVTSADGRNRYTKRTGAGGVFTIGGLGCTIWIVELVEVPNTASFASNTVRVNLNGGEFTAAEVRFRQQP